MSKETISRMILAKVLALPLRKYLNFLETMTGDVPPARKRRPPAHFRVYAQIDYRQRRLRFRVSDSRMLKNYSVPADSGHRLICSLHWINTRNRFSVHLVRSLLEAQRAYWVSGCEADLQPLSCREFLRQKPLQYLEASRLSRLIGSIQVSTPHQEIIGLKRLFPSGRRVAAYRIKQWVQAAPSRWGDRDLQRELGRQGLRVSLRSVIHGRRLLNIPSRRQRLSMCYGSKTPFGPPVSLNEKRYSRIPAEPGVYELRLPAPVSYARGQSEAVYIGCSRDLRRRISSYSGKNQRNRQLQNLIQHKQVFVRVCPSPRYLALENELLAQFREHFGSLPKANTLGGSL
jgi:hypothetical protein